VENKNTTIFLSSLLFIITTFLTIIYFQVSSYAQLSVAEEEESFIRTLSENQFTSMVLSGIFLTALGYFGLKIKGAARKMGQVEQLMVEMKTVFEEIKELKAGGREQDRNLAKEVEKLCNKLEEVSKQVQTNKQEIYSNKEEINRILLDFFRDNYSNPARRKG
jgi:uncharacterized protein YlxW (UPF0749 family)